MAHAAGDSHEIVIYGAHFRASFPVLDADGDLVTGMTTPDTEVSQDGGTFADCSNEATELATNSGTYYIDLIGTETDCKQCVVISKSATAGMKTTTLVLYPERLCILASGTAQAGGASTITLAASTSKVDNDLAGLYVFISNNGAAGSQYQVRKIISNVASTQVATVDSAWGTNPSSSSTYDLLSRMTCNVSSFAGTLPTTIATAGIQDVNAKNINNVATASVTTINANLGQTQPVNFTGTGASALVKSDLIDIAGIAWASTTLFTLASHDPGTTLGTSTLTQTQVTGGTYALNSASFAFNAALDFTTTQKAATLARVTLVDTTTTNTDMRGTDNAALAATALSTVQWTNTLATNLGTLAGHDPGATLASTTNITAGTITDITNQVIASGTATAGGASSITLQTALGTDSLPIGSRINLISGTGSGQSRVITGYTNATKVLTVDNVWVTNPDATTVYRIVYDHLGQTSGDGYYIADLYSIKGQLVNNAGTVTFPTNATLASTTNITAGTITTVTNQLTVAQIATGVWTDTTAGDFTTALSIGKSIMNGVALGTGLTINAYTGNTPQTGDSYAIVNSGTFGNSALKTLIDAVDNFVDTEVAAIVAAIGTPSNLGGGATLAANLSDIEGQTDDIGAAGAGLTAILTTAGTEAYRADGATGSVFQLLYELIAHHGEASISGTTKTLKKVDGSTTAATYTLDSSTTPTSITRAT